MGWRLQASFFLPFFNKQQIWNRFICTIPLFVNSSILITTTSFCWSILVSVETNGTAWAWLSFPPVCPRRPEVGIHPGEWSFTHSHWPFSATPPSLWPGRELRKFHCAVPGEWYSAFKVRLSALGYSPSGVDALAVTIVYLKSEYFFRTCQVRFFLSKPDLTGPVLR